jgi:predicted molibdopterin-dependent oxidoreductase YjgC
VQEVRVTAAASGLTKTHCPYCSLQCGITLDAATAPVALAPQQDFPTNLGGLCAKGWTAAELLDHPQRLTRPLVRDSRRSAGDAGTGRAAGQDRVSDVPEEVFTELRRASAGGKADYAGISYPRIKAEQGVFWPCPSPLHPGTPRLFTEDFPTRDRRAQFHQVEQIGAAELPDDDYPYRRQPLGHRSDP